MNTGKGLYDMHFDMLEDPIWKYGILEKRGGAIIMLNAGNAIMRSNGAPIITIARAIYDINSQKLTGIHRVTRIDGKKVMISGYQIPDTPMVVICYTDSEISVLSNTAIYALALLVVVFIFAVLIAANYITRNITTARI